MAINAAGLDCFALGAVRAERALIEAPYDDGYKAESWERTFGGEKQCHLNTDGQKKPDLPRSTCTALHHDDVSFSENERSWHLQ